MITCIIVLVVVCDDQGGERKYLVSVHLLDFWHYLQCSNFEAPAAARVLTVVRVLHYVYKYTPDTIAM